MTLTRKTFSITMTVAVNVTVKANSVKEAKALALGTVLANVSEFDRKIDYVEDITPIPRKTRRGIGG